MTNITNFNSSVQLIEENEAAKYDSAYASLLTANGTVKWAKIIVTDDKPNGNGFRTPRDEFEHIIASGRLMPIKMARGGISAGHAGAEPIGVIADMFIEGNAVLALAALWKHERPEDVSLIEDRISKGEDVNVSWEILYGGLDVEENVKVLRDVTLTGVAIVGMPAYRGRTKILAVAEENKQESGDDEMTQDILELQKKLDEAERELAELRAFKEEVEKERAEAARIEAIKEMFSSAGISKPDEYFKEHRTKLLTMSDEAIHLMISEIKSLAESTKVPQTASAVPPVVSMPTKVDVKSLAEQLRNSLK